MRAQKQQVFPLVGGTIDTQVASAFVLVPPTDRIRTGYIKENIADHTLLVHKSLLPHALQGACVAPRSLSTRVHSLQETADHYGSFF
jgi:hypothetical protein